MFGLYFVCPNCGAVTGMFAIMGMVRAASCSPPATGHRLSAKGATVVTLA